MGIIDTLSDSFNRVTKRLWLIVVPVLLDIAIWVGPRLSINSLSKQALAALPNTTELGGQYQQSLEIARQWLTDLGAETNILSLLSMRFLGLSSLMGAWATPAPPLGIARRALDIQSWPMLFGLVALLGMLSLLVGCFYLSLIAEEVRDEATDIVHALRVTWRSWGRLATLIFVGLLTLAIVTGGVIVTTSMLALFSPSLGSLMLSMFALATLWFSVYASVILFFTIRAVVLDDTGILRAIWNSLNIVHRNILSTIVFIVLISVIQMGLLYIWRVLAVSMAGTLVGIVGNAYVSTGLVMASFIFYRDRFVTWQEAKAQPDAGEGRT